MALGTSIAAYWKFDESSGNAADSVNNNTLTNNGSIAYAAGILNNGADLESTSSQYFSASDSASLSFTGDFSWSCWLKPETASADPVIWDKSNGTASQSLGYIQIDMTTHFLALINSDGANYGTATVTIPAMSAGTWYHLVLVFTASTHTIEVYFNGSSQGTAAGTLKTTMPDSSAPLQIGRYQAGAANYYDGMMDELGVWSRVLTSAEVTTLYGAGTPPAFSTFGVAVGGGVFMGINF